MFMLLLLRYAILSANTKLSLWLTLKLGDVKSQRRLLRLVDKVRWRTWPCSCVAESTWPEVLLATPNGNSCKDLIFKFTKSAHPPCVIRQGQALDVAALEPWAVAGLRHVWVQCDVERQEEPGGPTALLLFTYKDYLDPAGWVGRSIAQEEQSKQTPDELQIESSVSKNGYVPVLCVCLKAWVSCVSACASVGIVCILWLCLHRVTAGHVGGSGSCVQQVHSDDGVCVLQKSVKLTFARSRFLMCVCGNIICQLSLLERRGSVCTFKHVWRVSLDA